ncbi:hypothetical protein SGPA1_21583 [Streptomyces misionensis JCM 4497]
MRVLGRPARAADDHTRRSAGPAGERDRRPAHRLPRRRGRPPQLAQLPPGDPARRRPARGVRRLRQLVRGRRGERVPGRRPYPGHGPDLPPALTPLPEGPHPRRRALDRVGAFRRAGRHGSRGGS